MAVHSATALSDNLPRGREEGLLGRGVPAPLDHEGKNEVCC